MANEFTITSKLKLVNSNLNFNPASSTFQPDQTTANVSLQTISATTTGVTVSLATLTTPGIIQIQNVDTTNYVSIGLYISSTFYPLAELLPGETWIFRLARDILTANAGAAVLRLKANTATCSVLLQAFDK